jgi:serine/threonine protein kinase
MLLNNKYIFLENISKGQFGEIIKVKHNTNYYAIKVGTKDIIKYEAHVYKQLKGLTNVSKVYDIFEYCDKYCLVLDYYTKTLQDHKEEIFANCANYILTVINYIKELINSIAIIHSKNVIHRDIKPSNICLDSVDKVFLIDFGISKIYKNGTIHNSETKINGPLGSLNFSSLNTINLIEPSRRDDIESTIYVLLYMLLPQISYANYNNLDVIQKKDILTIIAFLKNNYDNAIDYEIFTKLFNYIRRLKYNQEPKYYYITTLLSSLIR